MADTRATRTLNPLHFEDLEPHRFEDLVRQLLYDFREWNSLEAVGRAGADEGIDIRASEFVGPPRVVAVRSGEAETQPAPDSRTWIIQCKREKALGPSDLPSIVEASIPEGSEPPYGFILAASATFSKKSRDAFAKECQRRGIKEFYVWGNGELEDMLLDVKHAHLLFLYFDITITGVFGRSRELANLRWELSDNIAALVMKARDAPFLHTLWADSLRHRLKLDAPSLKPIRLTKTDSDRLISFWVQLRGSGRRLRTAALMQAIASGEFLVRWKTGESVPNNAYLAMRLLVTAIERFQWAEATLEDKRSELTVLISMVARGDPYIDIGMETMVYLFSAHDRMTDVMRLSATLLSYVLDPSVEVQLPALAPISPLDDSIEGLVKEQATHEDVEAWVSDRYMRCQMTGQSYSTEDVEISRLRFPEYWGMLAAELQRRASDLAVKYGDELSRRMKEDGPEATLAWFGTIVQSEGRS